MGKRSGTVAVTRARAPRLSLGLFASVFGLLVGGYFVNGVAGLRGAPPVATGATPAPAATAPPREHGRSEDVVAKVDDQAITLGAVEREIAEVVRGREIAAAAKRRLQHQAREQLIDRELAFRELQTQRKLASEADVALALARMEKQLPEGRLTDALAARGWTLQEFRRYQRWRLSWQQYLRTQLTDANLRTYFAAHRRDFDGTQLRIAQILWKVPADNAAALANARAQAARIREQIAARQLSFADAARKHSQSPSAEQGGELGWIGRQATMPTAIHDAAFALAEGEVSQPLTTAFGVHLVHVLEVKPGNLAWRDVRGELERAVTEYLFTWLADRQRKLTPIHRAAWPD